MSIEALPNLYIVKVEMTELAIMLRSFVFTSLMIESETTPRVS